MVRASLMMTLTLLSLLTSFAFVVVGIGRILKGSELAFVQYVETIQLYTIQFLDINSDIMLALPVEGYWVDAVWSPDGQHLVFKQRIEETSYVSIADVDGEITLIDGGILPTWLSADRLMIWDAQNVGAFRIYSLNPVTLDSQSLDAFPRSCSDYRLSPDQRHIACGSSSEEWTMKLYILDSRQVQPPRFVARSNNYIEYDWSPEGRTLLYSTYDGADNQISMIDLETGIISQLSTIDWGAALASSPTSAFRYPRFAFFTTSSNHTLLRIMDSDGSVNDVDLNALVTAPIRSVGAIEWSPDGQHLVVELGVVSEYEFDLFLVSLTGTPTMRRLTVGGHYASSTWRP